MWQDLRPGDPRLIGPFRLRGVLGAGGMGRVFLGASADGQLAAVKVIHDGLAADPEFRARFRREVAVACKVSGPFTAPVIDADLDGATPWLATEYLAGPSLEEAVAEEGPMAPGAVLEVAARLAEGLAAIHAAGVVHRDLKPSNILLGPDGPRLIDFGISIASGATALTSTGLMIGSPGFMSPEQAEGRAVGPPSDIFSLGAVLAFAAMGRGPFGPGSTVALMYRVIHRPADLGDVREEVRALVDRCLVKDPALRPTARDLLAATGAGRPAPVLPAVALVPPDLPGPVPEERVPHPTAHNRPQRREHPLSGRRHWRSLTAAAILAGAAATAGFTLSAAHDRAPAAQSERQVATVPSPSPAAFAPLSSADPRTSASAAARMTSSEASSPGSTAPSASGTGLAGSAPLAAAGSPADANPAATSPPATSAPVSSARPSPSASPTPRPYPSASASPSPSAIPTPSSTSGGYGY